VPVSFSRADIIGFRSKEAPVFGIASRLAAIVFTLSWAAALNAQAPTDAAGGLPLGNAEAVGLDGARLQRIDEAVRRAIEQKEIPGAVILVARRGKTAYFKAFGHRAVKPAPEPMTADTIFDMASITKVMATTPAVMLLVEDGLVRLGDRVRRYLPRFTGGGKENITVRQLLTHYSGLKPDYDLSRRWEGYSAALEELWQETTEMEPGREFRYSDLNFIALGEIVRVVSGKSLDLFTQERLYAPLGMTETRFKPPAAWSPRIAPTEPRSRSLAYLKGEGTAGPSDEILRGQVHDPTAWRMEGIAGHAGLFSSARDVAIYAQMLLNKGMHRRTRILMPLSVQAMTTPQSPRGAAGVRGFGWDIDTSYSAPRGDVFPGGFGHTGFTGTSIWVCPEKDVFVLILSNRVHPDGSGDATRLRGVVANIVAASITD
jgi:CubicO group peptidase (beta-lactamase class C family)